MYAMASAIGVQLDEARPADAGRSSRRRLFGMLWSIKRKPKLDEGSAVPFPLSPLMRGIKDCFLQPCCLPAPIHIRDRTTVKISHDECEDELNEEGKDEKSVGFDGQEGKQASDWQQEREELTSGSCCLSTLLTKRCRKRRGIETKNNDALCCPMGQETDDDDSPKLVNPKDEVAIPFPLGSAIPLAKAIVAQPCCLPSLSPEKPKTSCKEDVHCSTWWM